MTTARETVRVDLAGRAYDIAIGRGVLAELGPRLQQLRRGAAACVVTDEVVAKHHLPAAMASLAAAGVRASSLTVPAGEASKSFATFQRLCEQVLDARIGRSDLLVALGGGVVGDLAGFVAASVRRGVDFIQAPTTLLAQVDSSVGGKTGINAPQGKNLVGAFHQPILVLADTSLLDTLPRRVLAAGYAEVAKYGLIDDPDFFAWLEANWQDVFAGGAGREHAIAVSCRAKAAIVARDERETGDRALLNLGHTFGHAIEAAAGFSDRLLHGEAVAIGTVLAHEFSARLGLAPKDAAERVRRHFSAVGLPTEIGQVRGLDTDADALMTLIGQDKKVTRGALTFILTRGIGRSFIAPDVDPAVVHAFLNERLRQAALA